jgi:hypothetical protein
MISFLLHLRSAASPQKILLASPCRRSSTAMQAMPIAEVAGEFAEITGVATVMFAITLVVGFFVYLRNICPCGLVSPRFASIMHEHSRCRYDASSHMCWRWLLHACFHRYHYRKRVILGHNRILIELQQLHRLTSTA